MRLNYSRKFKKYSKGSKVLKENNEKHSLFFGKFFKQIIHLNYNSKKIFTNIALLVDIF